MNGNYEIYFEQLLGRLYYYLLHSILIYDLYIFNCKCYCCYEIIVYHWIVKCEWPHSVDTHCPCPCYPQVNRTPAVSMRAGTGAGRVRTKIHIDRESMRMIKRIHLFGYFQRNEYWYIITLWLTASFCFVCLFVVWILCAVFFIRTHSYGSIPDCWTEHIIIRIKNNNNKIKYAKYIFDKS